MIIKFKENQLELKDETLGNQISYYRQLKGITQEQLAEETNISRDSIIRYETKGENKQ